VAHARADADFGVEQGVNLRFAADDRRIHEASCTKTHRRDTDDYT
jgi:hypothetical protein